MRIQSPLSRLLIALMFAAPLLTACTEEDIEFVTTLAKEWAAERGLIDSQGNPNYFNIGLLLADPASDPQAAAALQAGLVVKGLEDADRLAKEGAAQGDLSKIEAAIRARPNDWSYQEQKAALLAAQGDSSGATAAFEKSESLVLERVRQGGDCRSLARNMLTHRLDALVVQEDLHPSAELRGMIAETQNELALLANGQPISMCP